MARPVSRGDIVLTRFPFTDLSGSSVRPALVVSAGQIGDDFVLAGVSSVVRGPAIATDVLVESTHAEFGQTGLRVTSVLRLHKLAAVESRVIIRRLGSVGSQLQLLVDQGLRRALGL